MSRHPRNEGNDEHAAAWLARYIASLRLFGAEISESGAFAGVDGREKMDINQPTWKT